MEKNSEWMSVADAAWQLGLSVWTVRKMINRGDLPGYRMGRLVRVRQSDVDDWVDRSLIEPADLFIG